MELFNVKKPELSDFNLTQADVISIMKYEALLLKRKEVKEFISRAPFSFLATHTFVGFFIFVMLLCSAWKLKQAFIAGMIPCVWNFSRTLVLLFWLTPPSGYHDKKKAYQSYEEKQKEYHVALEEEKISKEAKQLIERRDARKAAAKAAQTAEQEKRIARKSIDFWHELDGVTFEHEFAALLKDTGFTDITLTATSGDEGIDLWGTDPSGNRCIFQCKAYKDAVVPAQVRELLGSLSAVKGKAKYAVMVALSGTTSGALSFAKKNEVLIWNGETLTEMAKSVVCQRESGR